MDTEHVRLTDQLIASWSENAGVWADAVRSGSIVSRRLVTDASIMQAVMRHRPRAVLDLGCGEGWPSHALATHVETVVGVDVSPELIAEAGKGQGASFLCVGYADLAFHPELAGRFDLVVANFALLDDDVESVLGAVSDLLRPEGVIVIQTIHPLMAPPPYVDGWREETFSGFGAGQWQPMPWYFRTVGSWINAIAAAFAIECVEEPLHPETQSPASLLITARCRAAG